MAFLKAFHKYLAFYEACGDIAVPDRLLGFHNNNIPVPDPVIDHAAAFYPQEKMVRRDELVKPDGIAGVDGDHGAPCGYLAYDEGLCTPDDPQAPLLSLIALYIALSLEGRDVVGYRSHRTDVEMRGNLPERRRVPAGKQPALDKIKDL